MTFDITNFRDALPVLCIIGAPEVQWVDVEILPINIYALLSQELVDVVGQPVPGFWVA